MTLKGSSINELNLNHEIIGNYRKENWLIQMGVQSVLIS